MATHSQHKHLNGVVVPMILDKMGFLEGVSEKEKKQLVLGLKELLKRYLGVASTARLGTKDFASFTDRVAMIAAREWAVYIPQKPYEPADSENLDLEEYLKIIGYYDN